MTLIQLIRKHCTNWQADGQGCRGVILEDDLQVRRCYSKAQCVLTVPGQRCRHFEECVLPMARSLPNPVYRQKFEDTVRSYRIVAKLVTGDLRSCPECGRTMERRRRFCPPGAAAHRKASTRRAVTKHRSVVQPSWT